MDINTASGARGTDHVLLSEYCALCLFAIRCSICCVRKAAVITGGNGGFVFGIKSSSLSLSVSVSLLRLLPISSDDDGSSRGGGPSLSLAPASGGVGTVQGCSLVGCDGIVVVVLVESLAFAACAVAICGTLSRVGQ